MKKLVLLSLLFVGLKSYAQEFQIRMNVTSCSTFTVQIRSIDAGALPSSGENIDGMDFSIISTDAFTLSVGSSFNGFSIGTSPTGTPSENGYSGFAYSESAFGTLSTSFVQNTWYDVVNMTISSGSTNLRIGSSTELPIYLGAFFGTASAPNFIEMGVAANNGSLAKQWLGGTSTAWATGSNWCPATAPSSGENLIITDGTNDPTLSATATVGSLEIQSNAVLSISGTNTLNISGGLSGSGTISGSTTASLNFTGTTASTLNMDQTTAGTTNVLNNLTVNNSGGLTLANAVQVIGVVTHTAGTIASGGNLTLKSTGTTTYGQIAGTGTGTISGNITVQKTLSDSSAGWRQVSLPVTGTVGGLSGIDLLGSGHSTANERNLYYWNATDAGSNKATGWTAAATTDDQTKAYQIFGSNTTGGLHSISKSWSITGGYNTNDRGFSGESTEDPGGSGASATGWNLVGNPYPSNLDISSMFTTSFGSISYKGIHIYDATSGQYKAILNGGQSITGYNTAGGSVASTVIAPFQAFWVKMDNDGTFTVDNDNRTTSATGLGTFMKKNFDLARFDVFDQDSAWDQAVIYFADQATEGFDGSFDAYKLISHKTDVPSFYAVNADGKFAINGLPVNQSEYAVNMGFRSNKIGQKSIRLNNSELDPKWFVYIEDKELGLFYDLKKAPYTFTETTNSDTRFVLHFTQAPLSSEKLVSSVQKMNIGGDGQEVYVFVPNHSTAELYEVEIFDLAGKKVYGDDKVALVHGMNTLDLPSVKPGYYVVRILDGENAVSGKVFIR